MDRIARNKKPRRAVAQINVVPYIDVMLVLLIIFMITAPLLQTGIEVDLPIAKAEAVDTSKTKPTIVSIDKDEHYYINVGNEKQAKSLAEIYATIKLLIKNKHLKEVLVRGDNAISYGVFVKVMSKVKQAGVEKVGLLTENNQ